MAPTEAAPISKSECARTSALTLRLPRMLSGRPPSTDDTPGPCRLTPRYGSRMADAWPEAVERVAAFLRSEGAEARIEEFAEATPTAPDAARVVGCDLPQIVKSLVFECDAGTVLVLVPGDRRADSRKVAQAAGCKRVAVAGPEGVREA